MGLPVKHTYKDGSPGAERKKAGMSLTDLKKGLAALETSTERTAKRKQYRAAGYLGGSK